VIPQNSPDTWQLCVVDSCDVMNVHVGQFLLFAQYELFCQPIQLPQVTSMAAQVDPAEAALIVLIVNPPNGEVCFLCATTKGRECVWNEIGHDIVAFGCVTGMCYGEPHHVQTPPLTLAEFHKACRFVCY